MARTAEITFKEFRRRYNTEDACRAELFRLRFPNGFSEFSCARSRYVFGLFLLFCIFLQMHRGQQNGGAIPQHTMAEMSSYSKALT